MNVTKYVLEGIVQRATEKEVGKKMIKMYFLIGLPKFVVCRIIVGKQTRTLPIDNYETGMDLLLNIETFCAPLSQM